MKKRLAIYFDMDGVQADFDKALEGQFERMYQKGFFRNLEVIGNPNKVFKALQEKGFEVYILSACVDSPYCEIEKIEWLREHCPSIKRENIILCKVGENKTDFIKTPIYRSVLVDDYKVNLLKWQEEGGHAIKFGRVFKTHRPYAQIALDLANVIPVIEKLEAEGE